MNIIDKYPLLAKLLLIQLITIGCGLLILLGVYQFTEQAQLDSSLSRLKEQVTPAVAVRQEQWRAWKYLGLDAAIKEETDQILKQFALRSINVVLKKDLPRPLANTSMVFPPESVPPEDYVVVVELNSDQIGDPTHAKSTVLIALGAISVLFLGIILFSGRYIYRRVYLPILTLNQILSNRDRNDRTDLRSVPAIGEMRDFLNTLSETLSKSIEENELLAREAAFGGVAKSVAHDIRSPLSALNMLLGISTTLPEDQRDLMRAAIMRINRIADGLLQRSKKSEPAELNIQQRDELISNLVTSLISEKRLEMGSKKDLSLDLEIDSSALGAFSIIDANQFSRVVSNILNNAVEAGATKISTKLAATNDDVVLSVEDNGKGIPAGVLSQLKTKNVSYGKMGGSGLGLQSLKQLSKTNNSDFEILSEMGKGTTVTLHMKTTGRASWLWNPTQLSHARRIVIVDDDPSIPIFWRRYLHSAAPNIDIVYFASPTEFEQWLARETLVKNELILMDFNFENDKRNGIEIAREAGVGDRCVIVTARSLDREFIESVIDANLVLFPKSHIGNN